ncbi:DUF305 domain-containing protein [Microbacterium sp. MC2]
MRFRILALSTGALAAALVLAGCAPTDGSMPGMDHGTGGMTSSTPAPSGQASFNSADEMFVTMMIPHHEQAIEMADQILAKDGIDERVVTLAEQIKAAQGPEIQTMKGWLEDWRIPYDDSMSDMGGMDGMDHGDGMMSDDDMAALDAATGVEATRLFLEGMIGHHQGAVTMAQMVLNNGENPDVSALAQQIIDGQTAEITTMQDILATL